MSHVLKLSLSVRNNVDNPAQVLNIFPPKLHLNWTRTAGYVRKPNSSRSHSELELPNSNRSRIQSVFVQFCSTVISATVCSCCNPMLHLRIGRKLAKWHKTARTAGLSWPFQLWQFQLAWDSALESLAALTLTVTSPCHSPKWVRNTFVIHAS